MGVGGGGLLDDYQLVSHECPVAEQKEPVPFWGEQHSESLKAAVQTLGRTRKVDTPRRYPIERRSLLCEPRMIDAVIKRMA